MICTASTLHQWGGEIKETDGRDAWITLTNAYKILVAKPEGRDHLRELVFGG
jgi:hypothetical protein